MKVLNQHDLEKVSGGIFSFGDSVFNLWEQIMHALAGIEPASQTVVPNFVADKSQVVVNKAQK
jgi:hypothetical protein